MATATRWHGKIFEEIGLISLWSSSRDTKLLCVQRFVRLFAYGGATLILVAYFEELQVPKTQIGLFMTLTLVGDTVISFLLTLFADALGRKLVLAAGALLMAGSGVVFALSGNFWILLLAAIVGVISPSGNEIGPFRAIEESTLAHLTPSAQRGDIYAWYSLLGQAGAAIGMIVTGWVIQAMREKLQWRVINVYRIVFWMYAFLGIVKFLLALSLSKAVEAGKRAPVKPTGDSESAPLLGTNGESAQLVKPKKSSIRSMLPDISAESRGIVVKLCFLFGLDSFGSGLAALSWLTFYFKDKFHLPEGKLGSIFFVTGIIAATSMLLASSIAKRFGNVKTMVFTHLPSAIFLALVSVPNTLPPALTFLILRHCTASMDVAPRSAFLAAVILPQERTAVMGVFNVVKTFSQCISPFITGVLAERRSIGWSFVLAGIFKATYDLGILYVFLGHKTREEEVSEHEGRGAAPQTTGSDDREEE